MLRTVRDRVFDRIMPFEDADASWQDTEGDAPYCHKCASSSELVDVRLMTETHRCPDESCDNDGGVRVWWPFVFLAAPALLTYSGSLALGLGAGPAGVLALAVGFVVNWIRLPLAEEIEEQLQEVPA